MLNRMLGFLLLFLVLRSQQGADPFALAASTDPDTMYYHQAMEQPDWDKFIEGM